MKTRDLFYCDKDSPSTVEMEKSKDVANWRKVKQGMSSKQVRDILGDPESIETKEHSIYWLYASDLSEAVVTFNK